jgi:hypothetical protein
MMSAEVRAFSKSENSYKNRAKPRSSIDHNKYIFYFRLLDLRGYWRLLLKNVQGDLASWGPEIVGFP